MLQDLKKSMPGQARLNQEAKFILYSSRTELNSDLILSLKELLTHQPLDWNKIFTIARKQGVASLVYNNLNTHPEIKRHIPERVFLSFKNYYYSCLARNLKLWNEFLEILKNFEANGVDVIPLKGIMLAEFIYHNPGLRPIPADMDILVKDIYTYRASGILKNMGYKTTFNDNSLQKRHVAAFTKDKFIIEMHWGILPPWLNKINTERLWENSQLQLYKNQKIHTLSLEDTLLTLSLQIRHHWPDFQLFRLCDINEILTQYEKSLRWIYIRSACENYKIKEALYVSLYLTNLLFSSPLPEEVLLKISNAPIRRKLLMPILRNRIFDLVNNISSASISGYSTINIIVKYLWVDEPFQSFKIYRRIIKRLLKNRLSRMKRLFLVNKSLSQTSKEKS